MHRMSPILVILLESISREADQLAESLVGSEGDPTPDEVERLDALVVRCDALRWGVNRWANNRDNARDIERWAQLVEQGDPQPHRTAMDETIERDPLIVSRDKRIAELEAVVAEQRAHLAALTVAERPLVGDLARVAPTDDPTGELADAARPPTAIPPESIGVVIERWRERIEWAPNDARIGQLVYQARIADAGGRRSAVDEVLDSWFGQLGRPENPWVPDAIARLVQQLSVAAEIVSPLEATQAIAQQLAAIPPMPASMPELPAPPTIGGSYAPSLRDDERTRAIKGAAAGETAYELDRALDAMDAARAGELPAKEALEQLRRATDSLGTSSAIEGVPAALVPEPAIVPIPVPSPPRYSFRVCARVSCARNAIEGSSYCGEHLDEQPF